MNGLLSLESCCGRPKMSNSVLEGLRDRKLEDIQLDTLVIVFSWWVILWEKSRAENDKRSNYYQQGCSLGIDVSVSRHNLHVSEFACRIIFVYLNLVSYIICTISSLRQLSRYWNLTFLTLLGRVTVYDIMIMAIVPAKPNLCFNLD